MSPAAFLHFSGIRKSPFHRGAALAACLMVLAACGGTEPENDPPVHPDDAIWILDSAYTLDEFNYETAACAEVFPAGSAKVDSVPSDAIADLRIRSTACYLARVSVVNADSDTVRTFETRFGIFNREEGDKNRAEVGFLAWDGKDDQGGLSPAGRYLWRIDFDFGKGRIRKFKSEFIVP